jgi:hypothetical protein
MAFGCSGTGHDGVGRLGPAGFVFSSSFSSSSSSSIFSDYENEDEDEEDSKASGNKRVILSQPRSLTGAGFFISA